MILTTSRPELSTCTTVTSAPSGLTATHQRSCAATVWRRDPKPHFQRWIDTLPTEELPRARLILRPETVCNALIDIANGCGTPECVERNIMIEDASALASIFASIMKSSYLRLRIDVVNTNACRKFHVDAVTARLICTYLGTGTQYRTSKNGREPERIMTVPTGSPTILRGTRWPETPVSGLLHRSLPIMGTGETRLLLVLDPIEDPAIEVESVYLH